MSNQLTYTLKVFDDTSGDGLFDFMSELTERGFRWELRYQDGPKIVRLETSAGFDKMLKESRNA
jgi:hypothetical protein